MNDRGDQQPNDLLLARSVSLTAERLLKKADESRYRSAAARSTSLIALVERAGEVVTHRELISTVWPGVTVEDATLRAQIAALQRRRLATGETALATYPMLLVAGIVLLRHSHAQAPGNRFRSPRLPAQNEFKGCRRD